MFMDKLFAIFPMIKNFMVSIFSIYNPRQNIWNYVKKSGKIGKR